jgi:outer membrane protein insertion porin family
MTFTQKTKGTLLLLCLFGWMLSAQDTAPIIGEIKVDGLKKSKRSFIDILIHSKVGKAIDSSLVQADILRLIREPAVSHATYEIIQVDEKQAALVFHIEENFTLIPAVDLWTTVEDQFAFHLGVNDYNFLGRGYTAGFFYRKNIYSGYGFLFGNPNFITSKLGYKIIGQHNKTLEPIRDEFNESFFDYINNSLEFLMDYELNLKNKVSLGFGMISEKYVKNKGVDLQEVPNEFETSKFLGKVLYDYDTLNYHYYFTEGFRSFTNFTYVTGLNINGDQRFVSFENDFFFYKRIKSKGNWATRLKIGFATNTASPFAPFAIDNNQNIRGIGNLVQRGSGVLALNTEYRHTLIEKKWFVLQANSFWDIGSLRQSGDDLNTLFKNKSVETRAGIGVRFIHKYIFKAIIRIDYGFSFDNKNPGGLVFGISQYF